MKMSSRFLAIVVILSNAIRIPLETYEWICSICGSEKPRFEVQIEKEEELGDSVTLNLFFWRDNQVSTEKDHVDFFYLMTCQPDGRDLHLDPPMYELYVGEELFSELIELHLDVLSSALTENSLLWKSGTSVRIKSAVVAPISLVDKQDDHLQFQITFPLSETY
jgi:hypothetical protein